MDKNDVLQQFRHHLAVLHIPKKSAASHRKHGSGLVTPKASQAVHNYRFSTGLNSCVEQKAYYDSLYASVSQLVARWPAGLSFAGSIPGQTREQCGVSKHCSHAHFPRGTSSRGRRVSTFSRALRTFKRDNLSPVLPCDVAQSRSFFVTLVPNHPSTTQSFRSRLIVSNTSSIANQRGNLANK